MSDIRLNVMVVDDMPDNRTLMQFVLEDHYDVNCVSSGSECITGVRQQAPDIILLDINMPEMDGYEVCRRLKADASTAPIPIIFVSALDSPEERLAGYEVGGEDYITKPFDEDRLLGKVEETLRQKLENSQLNNQAESAMGVALEAMANSSELGILNRFMADSALQTTASELAGALVAVTREFGLNCVVQIRSKTKLYHHGCEDASVEAKLMQKVHENGKVIDFGTRTIINHASLSLLAKNMPVDDETKYGRIKDHLMVLVNSAAARYHGIEIESSLADAREELLIKLIDKNQQGIEKICTAVSAQEEETQQVMRQLLERMEERLMFMGLEEDQEKTLIRMVDQSVIELENMNKLGEVVRTGFSEVILGLQQLAGDAS